jgi:hypothetical protein
MKMTRSEMIQGTLAAVPAMAIASSNVRCVGRKESIVDKCPSNSAQVERV